MEVIDTAAPARNAFADYIRYQREEPMRQAELQAANLRNQAGALSLDQLKNKIDTEHAMKQAAEENAALPLNPYVGPEYEGAGFNNPSTITRGLPPPPPEGGYQKPMEAVIYQQALKSGDPDLMAKANDLMDHHVGLLVKQGDDDGAAKFMNDVTGAHFVPGPRKEDFVTFSSADGTHVAWNIKTGKETHLGTEKVQAFAPGSTVGTAAQVAAGKGTTLPDRSRLVPSDVDKWIAARKAAHATAGKPYSQQQEAQDRYSYHIAGTLETQKNKPVPGMSTAKDKLAIEKNYQNELRSIEKSRLVPIQTVDEYGMKVFRALTDDEIENQKSLAQDRYDEEMRSAGFNVGERTPPELGEDTVAPHAPTQEGAAPVTPKVTHQIGETMPGTFHGKPALVKWDGTKWVLVTK